MKVLVCVPDNKSLGGVHIRALAVAEKGSAYGVETIFAVTRDCGDMVFTNECIKRGFEIHEYFGKSRPSVEKNGFLTLLGLLKYILLLPFSIISFLKILRLIKPQIIHNNGLMNIVPILSSSFFRETKVVHHLIGNHYSPVILALYSRISTLADEHIYISPRLKDYYQGASKGSGIILYEPLTRELKSMNNLCKVDKTQLVIGNVANYTPAKNWELWIRVAHSISVIYPNIKFICIGKVVSGHEKYFDGLKLASKGLNIEWTGFRKNVIDHIENFSVFLLTSRFEGTPLVLLEAASVCTPIVTSSIGGIRDMFSSEEVIFVDNNNENDYVNQIRYLLENKKEALEMSLKARRKIESKYDIDFHAKQMSQIYESIIR